MDRSNLDELMVKASNLPHLLVAIPPGELTPEVKNNILSELQAQLNDQRLAEKLGRAFMLGRLHRQMDVKLAPTPPLDTVDECNLYAGGYQYDHQVNPLLDTLIEREREDEAERIEKFAQLTLRYEEVCKLRETVGPTLENMEEALMLRIDMQALTIANLLSHLRIVEARMAEDFGDLAGLVAHLGLLSEDKA